VDFDRKLLGTYAAWTEMQKKLAAYHAVASRPWTKAAEKYQSRAGAANQAISGENWRSLLGSWTALANDELLANQRTDEFLKVQRELLQAATEFRTRQTEVSETVSKLMGLPTQSDFDDVTRQLTELRRELRALSRRVDTAGAARPAAPSARSETPAAASVAAVNEDGAPP
jgi:polyhydroxyalkanoate synthase subunit PhaE